MVKIYLNNENAYLLFEKSGFINRKGITSYGLPE